MVAYRDLIYYFIFLFSFLSLIMLPALLFYHNGTGITDGEDYSTWSLGNLGYSTTECSLISMGAGTDDTVVPVPVTCDYGTYNSSEAYGVNYAGLMPNDYCVTVEDVNDLCSDYINSTYIDLEISS